ncbi:hypothetical protein CTI14_03975 [Methylobacterium radiotolerans]|nr:hypothetical protein CTI14_03975 [Methylobacterium radiotolerans]
MASRFDQAAIEAANRAEVTALLIRCGFRVYRPEADIEGEDLVLRLPDGTLGAAQLKPRVYVDQPRYGGLDLRMLFPIGPFTRRAAPVGSWCRTIRCSWRSSGGMAAHRSGQGRWHASRPGTGPARLPRAISDPAGG